VRAQDLFAVFAVAVAGCSTSSAATLESVGQSPGASFSPGLASMPVGIVLGLRLTGSSSAVVTAAVDDPTVATVAPTTQASEFVLIGLAAGQTVLHVFVNDQESTELPIQVTASTP